MQDLCGFTKDEIREMLLSIKLICKNNVCPLCPFRGDSGDCLLGENYPEDWAIDTEERNWCAFKN